MAASETQDINTVVLKLFEKLNESYWTQPEFWIGVVIGAVGLLFSILAYIEAKQAKTAALNAGEFIQIQSITIELNEILHSLQSITSDIQFEEARDILSNVTNKLRRYLASYKKKEEYQDACQKIFDSLQHASKALSDVKPSGPDLQSIGYGVVYSGIEGSFSIICGHVSELMGLFERRAIDGEGKKNGYE